MGIIGVAECKAGKTGQAQIIGTPVADEDYQCPFQFTGKLSKLTLTIDRPELSPEDIEKLKAAILSNPAAE